MTPTREIELSQFLIVYNQIKNILGIYSIKYTQ